MFSFLFGHAARGIDLARNNPQIIYTIFLMVAIPLAFLWSGQNFFSAANTNQERIEAQSIGLMQDTFAGVAAGRMGDSAFLQGLVDFFKEKNPSISEFIVVSNAGGAETVVASLSREEVGKPVDEVNRKISTEIAGIMETQTAVVPSVIGGERHWRAYRSIVNVSGGVLGYIMTDISMRDIDNLNAEGVITAFLYLFFIVIAIFFLLMRQARIIDYTVLYQRLKEVDQMKDDFISMAAHELRTPLAIIRGYVEILSGVKDLDEKNKENLRRIDVSAKQLNTLVGDILDVSRLEQGRMKFELAPFDLNECVRTITETFHPMAKEKVLMLSCETAPDLPKIMADADKMRQVVTNLIGNAVKYTKKGSVAVTTSLDKKTGRAVLRVSDTGIGISAEEQKRLFEKFSRIRNEETMDIQGTGLGLWITRQIVVSMAGVITVESIKGKGTDFIVTFPVIK